MYRQFHGLAGLRPSRTGLLFCALLAIAGCADGGPEEGAHESQLLLAEGDTVTIQDGFERDGDRINLITGWTTYIFWPTDGLPNTRKNAGVFIADEATQGPAAEGTRALYFFNRSWKTVKDVYLVSPGKSLQEFETARLRFSYLVFGLNATEACQANGGEYLRAEICNGSDADCGISESGLDAPKFTGTAWKQIFEHDPALDGNELTGHEHAKSDWVSADVSLALAGYDKQKPFRFRFHARIFDRPHRSLHHVHSAGQLIVAEPDEGPHDGDDACHDELKGGLAHISPSAAIDGVIATGIKPPPPTSSSSSSSSSSASSSSSSGSSSGASAGSTGGGEGPPVDPPIGL